MSIDLADEMRRLENDHSTGVLRVGDGAFQFVDGAVVFAECRRTTGLERLVVEAGVATADEWRRASAGELGDLRGRPRLEALTVLSIFDAAYFLLASSAIPEFRAAPAHWLAPVCRIAPHTLVEECARRGNPESGAWPASLVDRAPVIPARRVRRQRVVLTAGQAEVLATADTGRSISGIARDLGRTTFGCLVAVRDLTAAGLIEPPVPVVLTGPVPTSAETESGPRLRRRTRPAAAMPLPDRWEPVDREVLVRLRAALEELT
ncbi:hypothetical protein [Nocardia sp. NPDC050406]|uniref:hypothetical protein n=1 Tax=Nocardia sp. NPDC050406 TaxID=3364318 RepID=UPI0037B451A8